MVESVTMKAESNSPTLEESAKAMDDAAAAVVDPKLAGEPDTPERPEWLPEKFKSPEDLAKAYAELEKSRSKGKDDVADEAATEAAKEADTAAEGAVEAAGLNMDALSNEYTENGELTAESYEALEKVGITKDVVDQYIMGLEASADLLRNDLLSPVGGEEAYNDMVSWAADNLPEAEIDAFNSSLESGDTRQMKMAVENLNAKFSAANGNEPGRQLSGKGSNSAVAVYESTADLMKDMGNPEYQTNPTFRAKVAAKLERSSIL